MILNTYGRKVNIFSKGEGGSLILLGIFSGEEEMASAVFSCVSEQCTSNFTLAAFESSSWDDDFSPWPAEMPGQDRKFGGKGAELLHWLQKAVNELGSFDKIYIAGYSLAGLFSLWAVHETDLFDGCACCSGSLWFPGWEEYSKTHVLRKPGLVYLSLGGKENKAKDPIVATIGVRTKEQNEMLDTDIMVKKHTLVMNPGGHFASPDKRLAKGIVWLMSNQTEELKR